LPIHGWTAGPGVAGYFYGNATYHSPGRDSYFGELATSRPTRPGMGGHGTGEA